jgi:hypothetical protein
LLCWRIGRRRSDKPLELMRYQYQFMLQAAIGGGERQSLSVALQGARQISLRLLIVRLAHERTDQVLCRSGLRGSLAIYLRLQMGGDQAQLVL